MTAAELAVVEHVRSNPGLTFEDIIRDVKQPEQDVRDAIKKLRGKAIVRNWGRYYIPGDPRSMKFRDQKRNIVRQIEKRRDAVERGVGGAPERIQELEWVLQLLKENWPNEMFDMLEDAPDKDDAV